MELDENEEKLLRSVTFQNAQAILLARERAERELRQQQEWFRVTLSSIGDAVITTDLAGKVTFLNPVAEAMTGWKTSEAAGLALEKVFHIINEKTRAPVEHPIGQVLRQGVTVALSNHTALISKDGREAAIEDSAAPIKDADGNLCGAVMVFHDVTDRRRTEEAVREVAERLQLALSAGQLGDWSWDAVTDLVTLGSEAARIFGFPEGASITWQKMRELLPEEDREPVRLAVEEALANRSIYGVEYRVQRPSGERCWVLARGRAVYGKDGSVSGMIGVVQDITESRVSQENRSRLAAVVESSDDAIISMTLDGIVTTWNQGAERMFGYLAREVIGQPITLLIPENREDEEPRILERLRKGERVEHYETVRVRKDGIVLNVSLTVSPIHDANGRIVGASKISHDITGRKIREEELQEQTRVLELLNDTGRSIAAQLDLRKVVQTVTDSATKLSGARFGAFFYNVINQQGESFLLHALSGAPREAFEKFGQPRATDLFGPTFRGEAPVRCADVTHDPRYGKMAPVHGMPAGHLPVRSYLAVPVISRSGQVLGGLFFGHPEPNVFTEKAERLVVGVAAQAAVAMDNARLYDAAQQEIAERRRAEDALRMAKEQLGRYADDLEKQVSERTASLRETIGELEAFSYSITHDMRAPLRAMQGFSRMLLEECAPQLTLEGKDYLRRIATAAERMDRLIVDVLSYSKVARAELLLEPLDLGKLLREIIETYPAFQSPTADVQLKGGFPWVLGAEAILTQCVSNLLHNAVKFVAPGVVPRVRIRAEVAGDGTIVRVYFKDNGVGINPQLHERIFGIFQRVSNSYEGTGIGLAIVKKSVERMGGKVGLESDLEKGSTFWLDLKTAHGGTNAAS